MKLHKVSFSINLTALQVSGGTEPGMVTILLRHDIPKAKINNLSNALKIIRISGDQRGTDLSRQQCDANIIEGPRSFGIRIPGGTQFLANPSNQNLSCRLGLDKTAEFYESISELNQMSYFGMALGSQP